MKGGVVLFSDVPVLLLLVARWDPGLHQQHEGWSFPLQRWMWVSFLPKLPFSFFFFFFFFVILFIY